MKKKACIGLLLVFVLCVFFASSLFAVDSSTVQRSTKNFLFLERMRSFYNELTNSLYLNPVKPERVVKSKYTELELKRRGHRIRVHIVVPDGSNKKVIKANI